MTMMIGPAVLDPSLYIPELRLRRKQAVLDELVAQAARAGVVRDAAVLRDTLLLRERLCGTGIGKGVAVPHARSVVVMEPRLLVARSHRGIAWDADDDAPVQLVLLVLSPPETPEEAHAAFVASAAAVGRQQRNRTKLLDARAFEDIAGVFAELRA
jgi:PTS system fructose-specific IIC component